MMTPAGVTCLHRVAEVIRQQASHTTVEFGYFALVDQLHPGNQDYHHQVNQEPDKDAYCHWRKNET